MDLAVVYDPAVEVSVLVDTDAMKALGPVGVGPQSQAELQAFVSAMPEHIFSALGTYDLCIMWAQYWEREFAALHTTPEQGDNSAVESGSNTVGNAESLAERTAATDSDRPPEPQPADTDMEANASTPPVIVECFSCGGTGVVPGQTEGQTATCSLCNGLGKVQQPAAA
jgi:hypothetical protein